VPIGFGATIPQLLRRMIRFYFIRKHLTDVSLASRKSIAISFHESMKVGLDRLKPRRARISDLGRRRNHDHEKERFP